MLNHEKTVQSRLALTLINRQKPTTLRQRKSCIKSLQLSHARNLISQQTNIIINAKRRRLRYMLLITLPTLSPPTMRTQILHELSTRFRQQRLQRYLNVPNKMPPMFNLNRNS